MMSKLKNTTDSKPLFLVLYSILCIGIVTCAYIFVLDYSVYSINYMILSCFTLLFLAGIVLLVFFLKNNYKQPDWVFLLLGIPSSCAFAFFVLPNFVPDELYHICKIFDVPASIGGGPLSVPALLASDAIPHNYAECREILFSQNALTDRVIIERNLPYSFLLYITPGLVCMPLQFFGVHPLVLVIVARLVNAALFLAIGFIIIRILPLGKCIAIIYLLSPMVIQQSASCSADCLTNAISLLFIAFVLKMNSQQKITWKSIAIALLLLFFIAIAKYAYALLGFLFLLFLPRVKSKKKRWGILIAVIVVAIAGLIAMRAFSLGGLTITYMLDLIFDPLYGIGIFYETLCYYGEFYYASFLGAHLGQLDIAVWKPAILLFGALLVVSIFISVNKEKPLKKWDKVILWLTFLVIFVLVIIAQRQWAIEEHNMWNVIEGVQGRYFIPIAIMPLLALIGSRTSIVNERFLLAATPIICFTQMCALMAVITFFV